MKRFNLLFFSLIMLSASYSFAKHSDPIHNNEHIVNFSHVLFENSYIIYKSEEKTNMELLASISYNSNNEYFSLMTFEQIEMIQIYRDNGELEFQIPIKNALVHIALDDFVAGRYTVNIELESHRVLKTELTKK